jgi:hypothetical protein
VKVRRTSWHYRIYCFYRDLYEFKGEPQNLCRYFWATMGLSTFTALITPLVAVAWIGANVHDLYRSVRPAKNKPKKTTQEPGLLRSFLRAKKQKVCPRIEVVG